MSKKLRLDLQSCLGMGDIFGEGIEASEISTLAVCDQIPVGTAASDDMLNLSLRAAVASGKVLELVERLNSDTDETSAKNFSQVLLSDIVTNPYAAESRLFVDLGLWQKVSRATRIAMKRARGESSQVNVAFKDIYMGKLTDVFGADIDRLRGAEDEGGEVFDERCMEAVVQALQSGMDVFSEEEKKILIEEEKK